MATEEHWISAEHALELATDRSGRRVLRHLIESGDEAVRLEELLEAAVGDRLLPEHARDPNDRQLRVALQHVHLSKLAAAGVVDYDVRSATVRYYVTPRLEKPVRFVGDELRRWRLRASVRITRVDPNRRTP